MADFAVPRRGQLGLLWGVPHRAAPAVALDIYCVEILAQVIGKLGWPRLVLKSDLKAQIMTLMQERACMLAEEDCEIDFQA